MFTVETEQKLYKIRPLDVRILVVASVTKGVGDWSAYIGIVEGESHRTEFMEVVSLGTKVEQNIAGALFPDIALKYMWRS